MDLELVNFDDPSETRTFEKGRFEGLAPAREPKEFEYMPTEINGRPVQ